MTLVACPSCSGEGCEPHAIAGDPNGRCDGSGSVTEEKRAAIIEWHKSETYNRRFTDVDLEDDWDPMECD